MTGEATDGRVVLHVLPADLPRGAQVFARALADELGGPAGGQHVAVLFTGAVSSARADHDLGVRRRGRATLRQRATATVRLWRLARRLRADVVVAHGSEVLQYTWPLPLLERLPVVLCAIGVAAPSATTGWRRRFHAVMLRQPRCVAAVSADVAQECRDGFGVPAERLYVIPNGRAVGSGRSDRGSAESPPVLAFVGSMSSTKRPQLFVECVAALRDRGRTIAAWMAGEGDLLAGLRPAAAQAGVALLGARADVPELLAGADVLCFTSERTGEGMPGVLIEAGMAGLPVVATDVPGVRDVIVDGSTGYVVDAQDTAGLVDAMENLVVDRALRQRMGAAARRRCEAGFSLEASARAWSELLEHPCHRVRTPVD